MGTEIKETWKNLDAKNTKRRDKDRNILEKENSIQKRE
jgi:hypothetical protein